VPVGFLSNRHDKPGATGENACTRDDDSEGPSSARSGDITDHVASATPGAAKSGSVTPSAARFLRAADGVERAGPGRTSPTTPDRGHTASRDSGERGAVHVPTLAQDQDNDDQDDADADGNLASPPRLCFTHHPGRRFARG